jgi:hypothetical protein
MEPQQLEDGTTIHHVVTDAEVEAFRAGFVAAYRRIFARPPYEEDFSEEEAGAIYAKLASAPSRVMLLATGPRGDVTGFAVAVPLLHCSLEARTLGGIVPPKHTMYLAELGVDEAAPDELSTELTRLRLKLLDRDRYSHVVIRIAEGPLSSYEFYRALSFKDTGVTMTVNRRRTDGTVRGDERSFLSRVLSQVALD